MYHVFGTGFSAITLYLISYFLYRNGFYSQQIHRKFWNIILAITFIVTAFAGLFLALQISYKWNVPFIKSILKWHVEFGIGMAFTGIFHLSWHFSYFSDLIKTKKSNTCIGYGTDASISDYACNLFIVGFVSTAIQFLLLKELMNISGGYELVAGTFLGTWLLGSAVGSAAAGKSSLYNFKKINLFFFVSPLVSVFLLMVLSRLWMEPGETPSFLASMIFTLVVLFPFCFCSGFVFVRLIIKAKEAKGYIPGKSFSIETTGGIVAGIVISFFSAGLLNTYQMILLIILSGIIYLLTSCIIRRKTTSLIIKLITALLMAAIIIYAPDNFFRQILLRGLDVTSSEETPYGNITRAEYAGEESIYYNHRLLAYELDAIEREENIHYNLLQTDKPENVLVISGSIKSLLPEIMKYQVKEITFVERDPFLTRIEKSDLPSEKYNLIIENDDAFSFIRKTDKRYDAVIILLPPPSSLSLNRYYTLDFFISIKKKLNDDGVLSCSPGINPNYFNREAIRYHSSIYNSLDSVFNNVIPVAGNKLYFIASDKDLKTSFAQFSVQKDINNLYVSPDYLYDDLTAQKTDEIKMLMDKTVKINRTFAPIACFYYQHFNLSKDIKERTAVIILLVIAFILPSFFISGKNMVMYFSASALAGFEIVILLTLQTILGNMYQLTGLIIAGLMAGLASGSGIKTKFQEKHTFGKKLFLLICFYLIAGLIIRSFLTIQGRFAAIFSILLLAFIPAFLTGTLFRELTFQEKEGYNISGIYSADLTGSAMGFIVLAGLVIPVLGIRTSLFFLAFLIFAGYLTSKWAGRKN